MLRRAMRQRGISRDETFPPALKEKEKTMTIHRKQLLIAGAVILGAPGARSVVNTESRASKVQLMLASWSPDYLDTHPFADAFSFHVFLPSRILANVGL
jgi:hypothetical protein